MAPRIVSYSSALRGIKRRVSIAGKRFKELLRGRAVDQPVGRYVSIVGKPGGKGQGAS